MEAVKQCAECAYAAGKAPDCNMNGDGKNQCCGSRCTQWRCFCPLTVDGTSASAKGTDDQAASATDVAQRTTTYTLDFRLLYTTQLDTITPLLSTLFALPLCRDSFNLPASFAESEHQNSTQTRDLKVPINMHVIHVQTQLRTGGNKVMLVKKQKPACASRAKYGACDVFLYVCSSKALN